MNDLDARIRAAVTEIADAAPPPKPLPTAVSDVDDDRSYRWLAIAAATVLIVAGVVAIAAWQTVNDGSAPADSNPVTVPNTAPAPTPVTTDVSVTTPTTTPGTTSPTTEQPPAPGSVVVDGPVIAVGEGDVGRAGIVGGVLAHDGACLSLVDPDTGVQTAVVWRAGTTWNAERTSVVLPDGREVAPGDAVSAGGGTVPISGVNDQLRDALGGCAADGEAQVALVQQAETVEPLTNEVTTDPAQPIPSGELVMGPDDVVATRPDNSLWWYPGLLGDAPGEPVELLQLGAPSVTAEEGPGPNVVDAVAGVLDGSLVFGECCEPVAGAVSALTAPGAERVGIGFGTYPVIHPTERRFATVNMNALTVTDLATTTTTSSWFDTEPVVARSQVVWAGADGEWLVVLGWDFTSWRLESFRPDDLGRRVAMQPLDVPGPASSSGPYEVSMARVDADGNVVVAITDPTGTRLRAFDPDTLTATGDDVTLPAGASRVRIDTTGRTVWVDEAGDLVLLASGTEPRVVTSGVVDGWFAVPTSTTPG